MRICKNLSFSTSLILLLISHPAFAFFCPSNFNQIAEGDSIETVTQKCGKPDKQTTKEVKEEGPQQWNYYIPQTVTTAGLSPMQGTLKTEVSFDKNGKALNISVNGIGVGSSTICGTVIQLGDTRDMVKKACGEPAFINQQNTTTTNDTPPDKVTEFIYNTSPPAKLTFKNGKLMGQS